MNPTITLNPTTIVNPSIKSPKSINLVFVCTSNTCRSPMAEGIARDWVQKCSKNTHLKMTVTSAGISDEFEKPGSCASLNAIEVMKDRGIDLSNHRSKLITLQSLQNADKIYCVSERHRLWICENFPVFKNKAVVLGETIQDPWMQTRQVYEKCAEDLYKLVTFQLQQDFSLP